MSLTKKLMTLIGASCIALSAFAVQNNQGSESPTDCKKNPNEYKQGHVVQEHQMMGAYNAPARIDVNCSWDTFLSVSYLYWQMKEKGLELGLYNPASGTHSTVNMDFDYKSAFKVAAGMNLEHDNWTLMVEYTRVHGTNKKNRSVGGTDTITPYWMTTTTGQTLAKAKWECNIDLIDLIMGRAYYVGTKLTFFPFASLRGGWIDQEYKIDYTLSSTTTNVKYNSDSWLLGPRVGLNTNWLIGEGFRIFGNTAGGLYFQDFDVKGKQDTARYKDELGYITPNFEIDLGLGWGTYFSNSDWHFDIALSYDFQIFWNQNEMRSLRNSVTLTSDGSPADLMLQGLTVKLALDF